MTETIGYRYDDGGRAASGRKGSAGDCVARALAILTGRPYDECYRRLADANADFEGRSRSRKIRKHGRSARNGVHKRAGRKVFSEFGLVQVKIPPGPRPTFTEAHRIHGDCIVSTTRHVCAIVGDELRDTFDGRMAGWFRPVEGTGGGITEWVETERKAMSIWIRETDA